MANQPIPTLRRSFVFLLLSLVLLKPELRATAADSGFVGTRVTHTSANPKSHWTPERIQRAIRNHRLPILSSPPLMQPDAPIDANVRTSPPSGLGRGATNALPVLPGRVDTQFACPITRFETVFDTDNQGFPQKTIGVLFFDDPAGNPMVCSASLVDKRVLLTAGHCVSNGRGQWNRNFLWAPGFLDGDFPYGVGTGEYALTLSPWFNNFNFSFDVGFLLIAEPKGDELGWLGFMAGGSPNSKIWKQHGYPAAPPYDGQRLTVNTSAYGARECASGNPCPIAVGSPLTGGSSGGPWIYEQNGSPFANGLNSFKRSNCNANMHSPYFGQEVWDLFQNAIGRQ